MTIEKYDRSGGYKYVAYDNDREWFHFGDLFSFFC